MKPARDTGAGSQPAQTAARDDPSFLDHICVLILTHNEEANIGRTLEALVRFRSIVIVDSGSTDNTAGIAGRYPNTRVVTHAFEDHATQWNYGLTACGITAPWVLALDADYVVPENLAGEIASLPAGTSISGYRAGFRYLVQGRPLSGALYPPVTVLYRRESARYIQQGHTQRVLVEGAIRDLAGLISHDDRKPLARWFAAQMRYAALEANYLLESKGADIGRTGRIRLMMGPAPILVFFYTLLVKRCAFDGGAGWFYALQRMLVEIMIALELLDRRSRR